MVKIGIIGGGFSGLAVGYFLKGHDVTIVESGDRLGGLASWFKMPEWEWPVEKFVHHWFTSDKWVLRLVEELSLKKKFIIKDTKSACYYKGKIAELDSASSLLKFPYISIIDRLRMGAIMALLRLDTGYLKYEKMTAYSFLQKTMGKKAFQIVWEPLFIGKFGKHAKHINAAWFWGRVHPRTKSLAYIEGGFQTLVDKIADKIKENGGEILLNTKIKKITKNGNEFEIEAGNKKLKFEYVVLAIPLQVALQLYNFPKEYIKKNKSLKSIGAQYFVLELKNQFLDGIYWLNINEKEYPFTIVVEHTNFIDKKNYGNKHIIWVGRYLDYDHPLWQLNEKELLMKIIPYLKKINPKFEENWVNRYFFYRVKNAQPVVSLNYSKKIPKIETPVKNLYLANMNQIYPWDRGTNNALGLGFEVASKIKSKLKE